MNIIDKIVLLISPQKAYEREAWRQSLEDLRYYDAGSGGRLNAAWRTNNASAEITDRYNRDTIRARARDLERNSDIAQSVIRAYRRNVVGKGYTLQAMTPDERLNDQIEKYWKLWCKAEHCDVTGTQSFNQILRMAVTRKRVDGGMIILKRYVKDAAIVPLKLQCLDVDELDGTIASPKYRNDTVVGGIEYDSFHKPVGYFFRQYDVEGNQTTDSIFVPAKDVIFYFTKSRPSQIREISDMTATITRIRDVNEFVTAVSVKERIAACLSVFIKKTIPTGGIGRSGTVNTDGHVDYNGKTLTPGMIKEMNAGDEIQVVNPSGNSAEATSFLKLQYGLIGAGQGLSYETASRDMSQTNYSSARQSAIEDEVTFAEEIELLRERVMSEVYETFVISGYLSGVFNISDFWDNKYDYLQHEWVASPKKWIDPQKESNANQLALKSGQKTFKQIAAENGRDWRDQLDDIAEVIEYAHKLGLEIGGGEIGEYKQKEEPADDAEGADGADDASEGGTDGEVETEAGGTE
jgi:lambda family phage portal protein